MYILTIGLTRIRMPACARTNACVDFVEQHPPSFTDGNRSNESPKAMPRSTSLLVKNNSYPLNC